MNREDFANMEALVKIKIAMDLIRGINALENALTARDVIAMEKPLKATRERLEALVAEARKRSRD